MKRLISLGKISDAISLLLSKSQKLNKRFHNECILISSRFHLLITEDRLGTILSKNEKLNQISLALLQVVDEYEKKKKHSLLRINLKNEDLINYKSKISIFRKFYR